MDFGSLNRMVFHTVDSLQSLANTMKTNPHQPPDLKKITDELATTNEALEKTIDQSQVSDAARKALTGLQKDLRAEVIRNISRQILTNVPLILQIQVGTAQSQQTIFSKELKKFEERLQYVINLLKKKRGGQAAQVEQDLQE
ncbi:MAG: hypothetical protein LLG04_18365 [Parachlamydia sp.]|nr:hypothetical protein [Parachlamydia sp.]